MKKELLILSALLFAACESDVSEPSRSDSDSIDIVASVKDLPKCNDKNDGVQVIIKGETSVRVCVDGDWSETAPEEVDPDTVFVDKDVSCKTEVLKDKSGYRIVCNGDSVGVVLNETEDVPIQDTIPDTVYVDKEVSCATEGLEDSSGVKIVCDGDSVGVVLYGAEGDKDTIPDTVYVDKEVSCTTEELEDSSGVKIVCNGDSVGVLPYFLPLDTTVAEVDSEMIAISIDSLVGFAQKGPFAGGSTVYLYELFDGRTLAQTGKNFTTQIDRSDRYKFPALDLQSQYAMVTAEGTYKNEVSGLTSKSPLRLRALSDLRMRASVNVNLLTHLEFDRVNNLVTVEKKSVKQAKNQALSEILSAFHIDPATIEGYAEDMDIFGKTDADAALLAISVLLLANLDDADFANLLTAISSDMESDGRWDDAEAKIRIAEWAMKAEMSGRLESIRQNVASFYHVSGSVPEFEKYVRNFWQTELGVGECNRSIDGDIVDVPNELSNVGSLECDEGTWKFFELRDLRDGKTYKVVKIGGQVWMAENLKAKIGLDGSPITMYCNSEVRDFCTDYGGLYTWEDAKKACPSGWHLPALTDWKTLVDTVDAMNKEAGKMLKSYDFWNGVDRYGFNALPAGYWDGDDYYGFGEFTIFWSSTEKAKSSAHVFTLYGEYDAAAFSDQLMSDAASVRCVQDE